MADPFIVNLPKGKRAPFLLSVPHCGVEFPPDVASQLLPRFVEDPEDTDWFVHELYDFAPQLGVTMIRARYSRYVIDLNRTPNRTPLYDDGRKETALVPTRSFGDEPLYEGAVPDVKEIARRRELYYDPYHQKLASLIAELKVEHGAVVVYDAHSIQRLVPTIRPTPFPDLILGDGNGKTADLRLREAALTALSASRQYQVSVNDPFQGGYITRQSGKPEAGVHALQLEMSQDIYLGHDGDLAPLKVHRLRAVLRSAVEALVAAVTELR